MPLCHLPLCHLSRVRMTEAPMSQRCASDRCLLHGDFRFPGDQPSHLSDRACSVIAPQVEQFQPSVLVSYPPTDGHLCGSGVPSARSISFRLPYSSDAIALGCPPQLHAAELLAPVQRFVAVRADRGDVH